MELFSSKRISKGNRRFKIFRDFVESYNLNFYKVCCLHWMATTGKKCNNKNHLKEIYTKKLDCEAALVSCVEFGIRFGAMNKEEFDGFIKSIKTKHEPTPTV